MIQPIAQTSMSDSSNSRKAKTKVYSGVNQNSPYIARYADSFVRHSVESVPVMGALTVFWSFVDKNRFGSLPKAIKHNAKNFFLPVVLITSAVTAFIENRTKKSAKETPDR